MTLRRFSLALAFLISSAVVSAFAQGGIQQEKIHFTVNSPFELKGSNVVLPSGKYVLFQIKPNDRYEFALYHEDMTHSPVAIVRAIRVYYSLGRLPDKTKLVLDHDQETPQKYPILEGWNVPGDYGWRVIRVTPKNGEMLTRLQVRK